MSTLNFQLRFHAMNAEAAELADYAEEAGTAENARYAEKTGTAERADYAEKAGSVEKVEYALISGKWKGKKALVIGDSITAARKWQLKLGELLGMDVVTHAKGGIGIVRMVDGDRGLDGEYTDATDAAGVLRPLMAEDVRGIDLIVAACRKELEAEGISVSDYLEKYTYAYPIWRCKRKAGEREGAPRLNGTPDQKKHCRDKRGCLSDAEREAANERCPSENYHECAIEQSFMEMLYKLKRDYDANGEGSFICTAFKEGGQPE